MDSNDVYQQVQGHYSSVARGAQPSASSALAQAFGYTEDELNNIPRDANLGLSCGNPLAIASLREESRPMLGETVIDLGSGAGFDVFLAAQRVGPRGRAIGVDMNKDMLARARTNHVKAGGAEHISFLESRITSVPIEGGVADCIISNCVINLVPGDEKPAVFAEMARLLKPGGRIAISDMLSRQPLPPALRRSVVAYVGCVAGCSPRRDYERFLAQNGFRDIVIVDAQYDLNIYTDKADGENGASRRATSCCGPPTVGPVPLTKQKHACCSGKGQNCSSEDVFNSDSTDSLGTTSKTREGETTSWDLADIDINEWVGSFRIFAVKK